jgi:hypothetical protein
MDACHSAPFWLSAFCAALTPTSIGYQDLAALIARQPGATASWRDHLIASPFGTINAATISYARPIGTAIPEPLEFQTVNFDPSINAKAWRIDEPLTARPARAIEYPTVNREGKGDRLPASNISPAPDRPASLPQLLPVNAPATQPASQPMQPAAPAVTPPPANADQHAEQPDAAPPASQLAQPATPAVTPPAAPAAPAVTPPAVNADQHAEQPDAAPPVVQVPVAQSPVTQMDAVNDAPSAVAPAGPHVDDAANAVQPGSDAPPGHDNARSSATDDDIAFNDKPPEIPAPGEINDAHASLDELSFVEGDTGARSAQIYFGSGVMGSPASLQTWAPGAEPIPAPPAVDNDIKLSALEGADVDSDTGGETVAGKGDATRLESPAERLGLLGKPRAEAQKCLADAVYFEARGEEMKGQEAVAQVVMNRVFSGYYPNDVCGVVYQNANRHLACQFTFACEGHDLNKIDEPDMWEQAKQIAKDTLDGKIWLTEVGHATHYHAYWVHPSWVHEMTKLYHLGVHTFYRPRAWGDGGDAPVWGTGPSASKTDAPGDKAAAAAPGSEAPAQNQDTAKRSPEVAVKGPQAAATPAPAPAVKSESTAAL